VAVIPARYGSTRLPRKALLTETGKFLVQHVWERVRAARRLARVIIATDHEEIQRAAASFGAEVMMTSPDHRSGTDRVHEVAQRLGADLVLNVQGDEPEVSPTAIDALVADLERGSTMATLACALTDPKKLVKPNHVKVVCDRIGRALYFSRAPIPWHEAGIAPGTLLHLGVYGFQRATLERFAALEPSRLELSERLEQLRALEHGIPIQVILSEHEFSGIDTPEDYAAFVAREKARPIGRWA
jgi:3-deoxy-manno-octulosonate cytidylyltransferase (CMP-KDO synthetase)